MTCPLDKDCVFANQQPECDRVQLCCNEKLAVKDAEIATLKLDNSHYLQHMHDMQREWLDTIRRLRKKVGELQNER
jgi:hypothetical protein